MSLEINYNIFGSNKIQIPLEKQTKGLEGLVFRIVTNPVSPSSIIDGQLASQVSLISKSYIQSSNFSTGVAGFQIKANGTVEFNDGINVGGKLFNSTIGAYDATKYYLRTA